MRRTALVAALAIMMPLALAACGSDDETVAEAALPSAAPPPPVATSSAPVVPLALEITPKDKAKNQPASVEIGTAVAGGTVEKVAVVDGAGRAVAGAMRADGTSWVPAKTLAFNASYTATVTARSAAGESITRTTSFSTMGRPGKEAGTGLYLFDDREYGVAMPVVVEFIPGVPESHRAAVEKRLFVQTDPPQPGVWSWVKGGSQAYYRAPEYWQPGTKLTVRIGIGGLETAPGTYGNQDRTATAEIGRKLEMRVDNSDKQMKIYEDGKLTRTLPVSLGKPKMPSASGVMVVMEKKEATVFDTFEQFGPVEGYRVDVEFAQRLTWSGQFIHAAPWSNASQGRENVSHGCVNVSQDGGQWLFGKTLIGDPVTVTGTGVELEEGNGWTAWNVSWAQFIKGSALPIPDNLTNVTPSPTNSPS
ncbi:MULTISPECIES: L,D-transpeptidase [Catenuloplanes]|uniref:Lipoprotein-anchoring transpeptidase ErfK/SrfK n=1 Tax=Catenuloplanes niger TaxID=587534 RepID=A0AAE3ZN49_9ACTN|nr:Ig-like domain-containing protein [Catenuloplanes niger]MDR7322261.1 lipoprotein-anchoring transpeptidase ErfK/SrfK [Catenuloplanes niger]